VTRNPGCRPSQSPRAPAPAGATSGGGRRRPPSWRCSGASRRLTARRRPQLIRMPRVDADLLGLVPMPASWAVDDGVRNRVRLPRCGRCASVNSFARPKRAAARVAPFHAALASWQVLPYSSQLRRGLVHALIKGACGAPRPPAASPGGVLRRCLRPASATGACDSTRSTAAPYTKP